MTHDQIGGNESLNNTPAENPGVDSIKELMAPESKGQELEGQRVLAEAVKIVEQLLELTTGHDEYDRRKIACYIVATHYVSMFEIFPGLVLFGLPSTGKSTTLSIVKLTCYKPVLVTGEAITEAALIADMHKANDGTLIIEEAEKISAPRMNAEILLATRYARSSARLTRMVRKGADWKPQELETFGPVVMHRRNLFHDPALLRRVLLVKTSRVKGKKYVRVSEQNEMVGAFHRLTESRPKLLLVEDEWAGIEAGIFDCYRPVLTVAAHLNDARFTESLVKEMRDRSKGMEEDQGSLEAPTLLRALIALVYKKVKDTPPGKRVGIETKSIEPCVREEFGGRSPVLSLSAQQRNRILRDDFGFVVKSAGGGYWIYITIPELIKLCDEHGIEDDVVEEWRERLGISRP